MSVGYIKVNTFTAGGALPLEKVKISIFNSKTGFKHCFETGEKSEKIMVYAPNSKLANDKNSNEKPYEEYEITAEKQGYFSVDIRGVQVFGSETSLQNIYMIPQGENDIYEQKTQYFDIPANNAYFGNEYGREFDEAPKVLGKVYIPEKIKVHMGKPKESGKNVYVPFPEYIKNVASGEVYPTWDTECLKANIYAQISFALNRIYTEYYPSRNYDFDITSSPAYDQIYTEGRNIFENISDIVDDIFNVYIVRKGYKEPLASSYCDGKNVTCKGLSQWGSLALAQDGKNALEILKYYYGDVELKTAENIQGIEYSFKETLKEGSEGENVKILQNQLNAISANYPSIPKIPVESGVFDEFTKNAVIAFQNKFSLKADGVAGKSTWYKISYIYTAVRRLALLNSLGETTDVPPSPPEEILEFGSSGVNVSLLQLLLGEISEYYDSVGYVESDGIFGRNTKNSLEDFQRTFGLDINGKTDIRTWQTLYDVYEGIVNKVHVPPQPQPNVPEITACDLPPTVTKKYPGSIIKIGARGENVRMIQEYLDYIALSLDRYGKKNALKIIMPDGKFGTDTKTAVEAFQRRYGLADDGIVGKDTWNMIVKVYNNPCN